MDAYHGTQNLIQLCVLQYLKFDMTLCVTLYDMNCMLIKSIMWLRVIYDFPNHGIQNLI